MKNVYFISGLGATKRSFHFLDLSYCNPIFLDWIKPLEKESLASYAMRLKEGITEPNPVIVGLSFGGMLVSEMARVDPGIRGIIISSNKNSIEFPRYLRVGKYLPLYKMIPDAIAKRVKFLFRWFLGAAGEEQKEVQKLILEETDTRFTIVAIDMIMNWKAEGVPENIVHIHGTADRLLPYKMVKADYTISGGTHLMVMNHARELSVILKEIIIGTPTFAHRKNK